jgi:hypothetical protein
MRISEHTFEREDVVLDFHEFDHCVFVDCRFFIHGAGAFKLIGNEIRGGSFVLAGPAALTLQVLRELYHGGGAEWVEALIAGLRRPPSPPTGAG